jgi:hypothetical protein
MVTTTTFTGIGAARIGAAGMGAARMGAACEDTSVGPACDGAATTPLRMATPNFNATVHARIPPENMDFNSLPSGSLV